MSFSRYLTILFLLIIATLQAGAQDQEHPVLGERARVVIPFRYVHNFIIVKVKMFNLLPLSFIVDTGAENTILFRKEITDIFNVEYERRLPILGSDLSRELYALITRGIHLEVDGLPTVSQDILVLEEDVFQLDELTGTRIDGILGGSFFKQTVLKIDYRRQKLIMYNGSAFEEPGQDFLRVPVTIRNSKPYIEANATLMDGTKVTVDLLVDTGAGLPVLLHNNTHSSLKIPENHILGKLGVGLGGYIQGYIGRLQELKVASLNFSQVIASFQDLSNNIVTDQVRFRNGLIGNDLLSRCVVYIDYISEAMYLKPRKNFDSKFEMDKSGLILFAAGRELNEFIVQHVITGSPADEAGIKAGDVIKRLQGFPANFYTLDHVNHILQKRVGKRIRLKILRGNVELKKEFKLRELI